MCVTTIHEMQAPDCRLQVSYENEGPALAKRTSYLLMFEFCLLFQNNTRGKFTRENPQELQYQIRNECSVMSYYITIVFIEGQLSYSWL